MHGWIKKLKNRLNYENQKTNNRKNQTVKKTRFNQLKFKKNRPVRFRIYKSDIKKTKLNQTEPKQKNRAKPEKNRAKPKKPSQTGFCLKKLNRTETGRFEPVSVRFWFFKKINLIFFFI